MLNGLALSFSALVALIPSALLPFRRDAAKPDAVFWALLAVALAGSVVYCVIEFTGHWNTGLSSAFWVSIAASLALFAVVTATSREAWRLAPLLMPYLVFLGLIATIGSRAAEAEGLGGAFDAWLLIHIAVSVLTYALVTLAAVASVAAFLQERALKHKTADGLSRLLPSVNGAEQLQVRLLIIAEVVLAVGIVTGMSKLYRDQGAVLAFDHKTLLSLLAFGLIGLVIFLHNRSGLRGRRAAQVVLTAYLLLTLAYPGVKFIRTILIGA